MTTKHFLRRHSPVKKKKNVEFNITFQNEFIVGFLKSVYMNTINSIFENDEYTQHNRFDGIWWDFFFTPDGSRVVSPQT